MAFSDYTFAGLKSRIAFRLQDVPFYTDEVLGVAVNEAILDLVLFIRAKTQIFKTTSFILPSGTEAGQYASEYPLPPGTLWCESLTFDGMPLEPASGPEMAMTGSNQSTSTGSTFQGTPRWFFVRDEPNGGKTAEMFPRPDRAAEIRFWGGLTPAPLVNANDVPPFQTPFFKPIEYFGVWYCLDGHIEEQERADDFLKKYQMLRAEAKLGLRLDRKIKTQRLRDFT